MADLGERDTFPFEERTFLQRAMEALDEDNDKGKAILGRHSESVWTGKGESHTQWDLIRSAFSLVESCQITTERSAP